MQNPKTKRRKRGERNAKANQSAAENTAEFERPKMNVVRRTYSNYTLQTACNEYASDGQKKVIDLRLLRTCLASRRDGGLKVRKYLDKKICAIDMIFWTADLN